MRGGQDEHANPPLGKVNLDELRKDFLNDHEIKDGEFCRRVFI